MKTKKRLQHRDFKPNLYFINRFNNSKKIFFQNHNLKSVVKHEKFNT